MVTAVMAPAHIRSMAKPGTELRQSGQQGGGPADGQALVAGLGGGGDGDLVDPLGRQLGVAAQQLADAVDHQVVGAGLGRRCRPALPNGVRTPSTKTTSRNSRGMAHILLTSNNARSTGDFAADSYLCAVGSRHAADISLTIGNTRKGMVGMGAYAMGAPWLRFDCGERADRAQEWGEFERRLRDRWAEMTGKTQTRRGPGPAWRGFGPGFNTPGFPGPGHGGPPWARGMRGPKARRGDVRAAIRRCCRTHRATAIR